MLGVNSILVNKSPLLHVAVLSQSQGTRPNVASNHDNHYECIYCFLSLNTTWLWLSGRYRALEL